MITKKIYQWYDLSIPFGDMLMRKGWIYTHKDNWHEQHIVTEAMMTAGNRILEPYGLNFVDDAGNIEGDESLGYTDEDMKKIFHELDTRLFKDMLKILSKQW